MRHRHTGRCGSLCDADRDDLGGNLRTDPFILARGSHKRERGNRPAAEGVAPAAPAATVPAKMTGVGNVGGRIKLSLDPHSGHRNYGSRTGEEKRGARLFRAETIDATAAFASAKL